MIRFLEKNNFFSWLAVILLAIIIFYVSSLTLYGAPKTKILSILYHFSAFFWFAFFLSLALISGKKKNLIILAVILAVIYAVSDEVHQLFVPNRNFSISDILTDSAGILLANFAYLLTFKKSGNF